MSPPEGVSCDRDGPVLVITMCREHKRNAVDRALADAIDLALNQLEDDPDLRVGVLTGGTQVFCGLPRLRRVSFINNYRILTARHLANFAQNIRELLQSSNDDLRLFARESLSELARVLINTHHHTMCVFELIDRVL